MAQPDRESVNRFLNFRRRLDRVAGKTGIAPTLKKEDMCGPSGARVPQADEISFTGSKRFFVKQFNIVARKVITVVKLQETD